MRKAWIIGMAAALSLGVGAVAITASSNGVFNEDAVEARAETTYEYVSTAWSSLTTGDVGVIVGDNGETYALSNNKGTSSAPSATAVTVSGNKLSGDPADTVLWTVTVSDGNYQFSVGSTHLYCTAANNGVRVGTNDNNVFTIKSDSGYLFNSATSRFIGVYNSQDWRCYTSINNNIKGQSFAFYKKTAAQPAATLTGIALSGEYPTAFNAGDTFSHEGMTVTATYDDSNTADVTSKATFSGYDMATAGDQTVTVSYTEGDVTKTATYGITVSAPKVLTNVVVTGTATANKGGDWDFSGLEAEGFDQDGQSMGKLENATFSSAASTDTSGEMTITVTVTVGSKQFAIENVAAVVSKIGVVKDILDRSVTGVTGTSYKAWSDKVGTSGAVYAGNSAGGNESIQLRSSDNAGIITTSSIYKLKKISVRWNSNTAIGRKIDIYGKNTAYSSTADLYNSQTDTKGAELGSIEYGVSTELTVDGDYLYFGIRSSSSALWLEEIEITWQLNPTLESISVSGQKTSFVAGETFTLGPNAAVTATYSDDSTKPVTEYVVESADFDLDEPLVHGDNPQKEIGISYTEGNKTVSASYTITVEYKPATSVTLNYNSFSLGKGKTVTLVATVEDEYADPNVTWTSSNTDVATVTGGVVTAKQLPGTTTITATAGGLSATCEITVTGDPILNMKDEDGNVINDAVFDVFTGDADIYVTAEVEGVEDPTFVWASDDPDVADVTAADEMAEISIVGAGSAEISVTVGNLVRSITVNVTASAIENLTLSSDVPDGKIYTGDTKNSLTLTPDYTKVGTATEVFTWTSNNPDVADVDKTSTEGKASNEVLASNEGTAVITIRSNYDSSAFVSYTVTVCEEKILAFTLGENVPEAFKVFAGDKLTASDTANWTADVTWASGKTGTVGISDLTLSVDGTPITLDYTWKDADKKLQVSYQGATADIEADVVQLIDSIAVGDGKYHLVTSADDLYAGEEIIIANAEAGMAISTNQATNNRTATVVTIENGVIATPSDSVQIITLEEGSNDDTWAFNVGDGYLYAASGSKNYMKTQADIDENASFTVTFNGNEANIVATGSNTRNDMRYNPNSGNPIFSCYASTSEQAHPNIYAKVATDIANKYHDAQKAVVEFANYFNSQMSGAKVCGSGEAAGKGVDPTTVEFKTAWGNVASKFTNTVGALAGDDKTHAEDILKNAEAVWSDDESIHCVERALATYKWVVQHYASTDITPFMSDVRSFSSIAGVANIGEAKNSIAVVASVAGVGALAAAGLFIFHRKRREI